jgi:hypothetical protein
VKTRRWVVLVFMAVSLGCQACRQSAESSEALTPGRRAAIEDSVRQFTATVAHDVTQEGPIAWQRYFADSPNFFMAVDGKLIFPDGQAAAQAIPEIARQFQHIELRWGNDLRLDVLTENLCVVAGSYTEVIELKPGAEGPHGTENGYFTGVAEKQNGRWQFRNAHWSEPTPAPAKAK